MSWRRGVDGLGAASDAGEDRRGRQPWQHRVCMSACLHLAPLLYAKHRCWTFTTLTTREQDSHHGKETGKPVHACEELSSYQDSDPSPKTVICLDFNSSSRQANVLGVSVYQVITSRDCRACLEQIRPRHTLSNYPSRCLHGLSHPDCSCAIRLLYPCGQLRR